MSDRPFLRRKTMARSELAGQIWPHLQADRPVARDQPRQTSPAAARLYPNLVPSKPPPFNPHRESLLRNLRDLNARSNARLQKGK
jgi:hypothetical protein